MMPLMKIKQPNKIAFSIINVRLYTTMQFVFEK